MRHITREEILQGRRFFKKENPKVTYRFTRNGEAMTGQLTERIGKRMADHFLCCTVEFTQLSIILEIDDFNAIKVPFSRLYTE